jgi:HK97 family phage prohead protease
MTTHAQRIMQAVTDAQRFLAGLGTSAADPFTIEGHGYCWNSIAYGERGPTRINRDAFGPGPFVVPLLWQHEDKNPIGRATLAVDAVGLRADARISDTAAGRDALALIGDGALTGLSLGFTADRVEKGKDVRTVTRATLIELSVVTFPADDAARISTVGGKFVHAAPREIERGAAVTLRTLTRRAEREAAIEAAEAAFLGLPATTTTRTRERSEQERLGDVLFGRSPQEQAFGRAPVSRDHEEARRLTRYSNFIARHGRIDFGRWRAIDAAERGNR